MMVILFSLSSLTIEGLRISAESRDLDQDFSRNIILFEGNCPLSSQDPNLSSQYFQEHVSGERLSVGRVSCFNILRGSSQLIVFTTET